MAVTAAVVPEGVPTLQAAIRYSRTLYSFGDVAAFPSAALASHADDVDEDAEKGTGGDAAAAFPALPRGLDLSLARERDGDGAPARQCLAEAALAPPLVRPPAGSSSTRRSRPT